MDKDDLTVIDRPVLDWLAGNRSATLNGVVNSVTDLGSVAFLAPAIALTAIAVEWRLRSWRPNLDYGDHAGRGAGAGIRDQSAHRPAAARLCHPGRCREWILLPLRTRRELSCGYGMIAWLVCMTTKRGTIWATAWLSAFLLALAIGLSRICLSVHYPSDVIGGWLLAVTWLATVAVAVSVARARLARTGPSLALDLR